MREAGRRAFFARMSSAGTACLIVLLLADIGITPAKSQDRAKPIPASHDRLAPQSRR